MSNRIAPTDDIVSHGDALIALHNLMIDLKLKRYETITDERIEMIEKHLREIGACRKRIKLY